MLSLAEWVNKPDEIGNLVLTGKCIDLACVGLARLTANMEFPIEDCQKLAAKVRDSEKLVDVKRRAKVLDIESGSKLFSSCKDESDLDAVWTTGVRRHSRESLLQMAVNRKFYFDQSVFETPLASSEDIEKKRVSSHLRVFLTRQPNSLSVLPPFCHTP